VVDISSPIVAAWRLGWFGSARRHPGRSAAVGAVVFAVGVPLTWYLASPIWIRTSLVEVGSTGAPSIDAAPSPSAALVQPTMAPGTPAPALPTPTITSTPTTFAPTTVASGEFEGTDEFHFGRGTASIIEVEAGSFHLRLDDFSVRNGPDLYVYLSTAPDDYADDALEVGVLKATDGSFGYDLPRGLDPDKFASAIIWCKQFSHLFAVAPF
jgi:Electron transfer DM13